MPTIWWPIMGSDKKVQDGKIGFIVARGIGQAFQSRDIAASEAAAVLRDLLRETKR